MIFSRSGQEIGRVIFYREKWNGLTAGWLENTNHSSPFPIPPVDNSPNVFSLHLQTVAFISLYHDLLQLRCPMRIVITLSACLMLTGMAIRLPGEEPQGAKKVTAEEVQEILASVSNWGR